MNELCFRAPVERRVSDDVCDCGCEKEHVTCWNCGGEGGFHDCFDDTCCCLDKDSITDDCDICEGNGGYLVCPSCYPDSFDY